MSIQPSRYCVLLTLLVLGACFSGIAEAASGGDNSGFRLVTEPSFQVDIGTATADKPQSKLWYMDGSWWALIARKSGPSLWERTPEGWKEDVAVTKALAGVPRFADVWPGETGVTCVSVKGHRKDNESMTVFRLQRMGKQWTCRTLAKIMAPSSEEAIETATIIADSTGRWWVGAVAGEKVCVWTSEAEGTEWAGPIILAEGIKDDDICVVTPLKDKQISVLWSDQLRQGVFERNHKDGEPTVRWGKEQTVQMGGRCADDHLNTSLGPDGTLWVASKNEVDAAGKPQFVLRVRTPQGKWSNTPYAVRGETFMVSRPIVIATEDNSHVFTCYGSYDKAVKHARGSKLAVSRIDPRNPAKIGDPQDVVEPGKPYDSAIQNVTGPRNPFPKDAPWIVLVSDNEGRVYEADLRELVDAP